MTIIVPSFAWHMVLENTCIQLPAILVSLNYRKSCGRRTNATVHTSSSKHVMMRNMTGKLMSLSMQRLRDSGRRDLMSGQGRERPERDSWTTFWLYVDNKWKRNVSC